MKKILGAAALAATTALASPANAIDSISWDMQSTYPGSLTQLGTLGVRVADVLRQISDGEIDITFQEPGAITPALEAFDAVASGAIQAAWSTPGYWTGKDTSLALFAAVPFGPSAPEYYGWYRFGGGQEIFEEIYHTYNIHSIICAVIAPEAAGWFREPIESIDDLKGQKMRFFGLGAKVMEKAGVSTQLLAGGDIYPALELGTIDATEFSMPAIDLNLGFYQVAKHYYFPGWHQQSTMFELMINLDEWESLSEDTQAMINTACESNVAYGLAEGEGIQFTALKELEANGVTLHTWSDEILDTLEGYWNEVREEEVAANPNFAKAWDSLSTFRENYKTWGELGYLKR